MRVTTKPLFLSIIVIIIALTATTADLLLAPSHSSKDSLIKPTYIKELSTLDWHVDSLHKREIFVAGGLLESWLDPSLQDFYQQIEFDLMRFGSEDMLMFNTYHLAEFCTIEGDRHPFALTVIEHNNERVAWYVSNFAYIPGLFPLESRAVLMERLGCQRDV